MMVLQVIPDRFTEVEQNQQAWVKDDNGRGGMTAMSIRRPTRGIQVKEDTFASIRVVASGGNGRSIPLIDAGSTDDRYGNSRSQLYTNFLLQGVSEDRMEKQQILETFGEPYIFLFGERARVMTFQGVLLNTEDFNWEAEWWANYEEYLRGTRCVENQARVFMFFDETLVSGYILNTSSQKNAQERNHVPFSFQLFVTSWSTISRLGNPNAQPLKNTRVKNRAQAAPYLPKKVQSVGPGYTVTAASERDLSQKVLDGFSLAESLASRAVGVTTSAIASIRAQVAQVTAGINNTLNGTAVRVPVGFAGALEFDDAFTPSKPTSFEGAVKFGLYADNTDEYITPKSQYGSTIRDDGVNQVQFELPVVDRLSRDRKLVEKATEQWRKNGFSPPVLGPVSKQLVSTGIGLYRLGSSLSWQQQIKEKEQLAKLNDSLTRMRERMNLPKAPSLTAGRHGGGA